MNKKIELVVFDLDGTLTDSGTTIFKAVKATLKQLGIKGEITWEKFSLKIGAHFKEMLAEFNITLDDFELFMSIYKSYYFEYINDTKFYDGVEDTIAALNKSGIKIALLTTKAQDQADKVIDFLNLRENFDMVTGRRPGLGIKPDAAPLLFICSELNIKPENTMMVGDSELDINCGKNAGAVSCAVSYGYRKKEDLMKENPDFIIDSAGELLKLV